MSDVENYGLSFVFLNPLRIYSEAIISFFAGIYLATPVLCRNAIEGSLFLAVSRLPKSAKSGGGLIIIQSSDNWKSMGTDAKQKGILSSDDFFELSKLREKGHFSAHTVSKIEDSMFLSAPKTRDSHSEGVRKFTNAVNETVWAHEAWVSREQAGRILNETGNWILKIVRNYYKHYSELGEVAKSDKKIGIVQLGSGEERGRKV